MLGVQVAGSRDPILRNQKARLDPRQFDVVRRAERTRHDHRLVAQTLTCIKLFIAFPLYYYQAVKAAASQ
jgi:hypothetical protein